jgi:hypothetical protein
MMAKSAPDPKKEPDQHVDENVFFCCLGSNTADANDGGSGRIAEGHSP